ITTGILMSPMFEVFALNCLQNSIMFTPCGPSAVPMGGAGLALPAGTWSLIIAVTFFAITLFSVRSPTVRKGCSLSVQALPHGRASDTPNQNECLTLVRE